MYWVIQENIYNEPKYDELIQNLKHSGIPYSLHKVIPFIGELQPDIFPKNPVICIGTYSMRHVAIKKLWRPGVFDMKMYPHSHCQLKWPGHMLNDDACYFYFSLAARFSNDPFFIRPNDDSKYFAGTIMEQQELEEWQHKVRDLGEDDGTGLRNDTVVLLATPKEIYQEIRCWIVDQKVVTSSIYKIGKKVIYQLNLEQDVIDYAQRMTIKWNPLRCFVMDIARTPYGLKIIEAQTFNSCGFYAADMGKIITALEDAYKV